MRVGIIGAGAVAHGIAALLDTKKTNATLWSPSNRALAKQIDCGGAINGTLHINTEQDIETLANTHEIIIFALPTYGHKATIEAVAPYLTSEHHVAFSAYCSFGAEYLQRLLLKRDVDAPITVFNTTPITAKMPTANEVVINMIRAEIEMSTLPITQANTELELYQSLLGNHVIKKQTSLEVLLSNTNPQVHMGMALCNITRMEKGETWCQRAHVTPAVGRLIEDLDQERLAVARALGFKLDSIMEKYGKNAVKDIATTNQYLSKVKPVYGPKIIDTRYITEDVPFGLLVISKLGDFLGCKAPLHKSGVILFSSLYGRDFSKMNDLIQHVDFNALMPSA
ncbi:NAD/NADP octopine/nopaline dehydrogenase family protein [Aliiglaciecola sp.]|nr:NAD/NADP octopine/nopaline dehydrogenase family protein [Aliiglaciecola sp.]